MQDKILELLARGLSGAEVSRAIGCDESYISQLKKDPDFQVKLVEAQASRTQEYVDIDNKYDKVEKAAVDRLFEVVSTKILFLPHKELMGIAKFANEAKRRHGVLAPTTGAGVTHQIIINLPTANIPALEVVKSSNNEVLSVAGKSLLPMQSSQLLKTHKLAKAEQPLTLENF